MLTYETNLTRYWGVNESETFSSDIIGELNTVQTDKNRVWLHIEESDGYIYYAHPEILGPAIFKVNGLVNNDWIFTSEVINSENYIVYRSKNIQEIGEIIIEVMNSTEDGFTRFWGSSPNETIDEETVLSFRSRSTKRKSDTFYYPITYGYLYYAHLSSLGDAVFKVNGIGSNGWTRSNILVNGMNYYLYKSDQFQTSPKLNLFTHINQDT